MYKIRLLLSILCAIVNADISPNDAENSLDFTGKVVLITGSTSGIGETTVKLFSSLGAKVVVTGRNQTNLFRVAEEVAKLSPQGLKPLQVLADVTKEEDMQRLLDLTIKEFGRLDILVNNAGGLMLGQDIKDSGILKIIDSQIANNLRPIVQLIHLSIPYLEKSKGTIINTSSIFGIIPTPPSTIAYHMVKAALEMLVKVLAVELGPSGIRVNNVNPGVVNTGILTRYGIQTLNMLYKKIAKATPLQRIGESVDIAKAIVYLASKDAEFITGVSLLVEGGLIFNSPRNWDPE